MNRILNSFFFFFLNLDQVKEEKQDTFVEKLVTQVIKNLQVKISNIHIRYEDDVSDFVYHKIRGCEKVY